MASQISQVRLSEAQRKLVELLMDQWGCTRFPDLIRAYLRLAATAGPPSDETLEALRKIERLPIEEQDLIDAKILELGKSGVAFRGRTLHRKLLHLLDDHETVSLPRPFACQKCRYMVMRDTGLSCEKGEDMLSGTPCDSNAQTPEILYRDQRWDMEPS